MNRNTLGSPSAELRSGPVTPPLLGQPASTPPFGTGSLNLTVAGGTTERVAFGNELDFLGQPFTLTAVGFHVYNVGENILGGANNMARIAIEIDPNLEPPSDPSNFSTLTFFAPASLPGVWSDYIDATTTGLWGATGGAFAGTPCDINGSLCSWADLQTLLSDGGDPPIMGSVAIAKGRDTPEWHGAVDGLRINNTVYNFEEYGVTAQPAV